MATVTINPDKTMSIDGKKTFPVYMYYTCNAHFENNTGVEPCNPSKNGEFLFSGGGASYQNFATNYNGKYEQSNEMYTLVGAQINEIPQELINSNSFFGYYSKDEPVAGDEDVLQSIYNRVKARDTNHPLILNVWSDMTKWIPYGDIISWDVYTIKKHRWSEINTKNVCEANGAYWDPVDNKCYYWPREYSIYIYEQWSRQADSVGNTLANLQTVNKPVWAVIQGNGLPCCGGILVPIPKEVRANTYTAITMNVNGIGYWGYLSWGGPLTSTPEFPYGTVGLYNNQILHQYYIQIAKEIIYLNDILILPTKDFSWHYRQGTGVTFNKTLTVQTFYGQRTNFNYILKQSGIATYLIVVNKDTRPISDVGITIQGLTGSMTATTIGLSEAGSIPGRTLPVTNGQFTDNFDGLAVHIYEIGSDIPCQPSQCDFKITQ